MTSVELAMMTRTVARAMPGAPIVRMKSALSKALETMDKTLMMRMKRVAWRETTTREQRVPRM